MSSYHVRTSPTNTLLRTTSILITRFLLNLRQDTHSWADGGGDATTTQAPVTSSTQYTSRSIYFPRSMLGNIGASLHSEFEANEDRDAKDDYGIGVDVCTDSGNASVP